MTLIQNEHVAEKHEEPESRTSAIQIEMEVLIWTRFLEKKQRLA